MKTKFNMKNLILVIPWSRWRSAWSVASSAHSFRLGERNFDYVHTFLKRHREVEGTSRPELQGWLDRFEKDKREAAFDF
jgi:hypothetical protein